MSRIDNASQLANLRLKHAAVEGAISVARVAQQAVDAAVQQYLETVSMLSGEPIGPGDQVRIDWESGEVLVEGRERLPNGVTHDV